MSRKPFPDIDEALLLAGKYLIRKLILGKHWIPRTIRQMAEVAFILAFWLIAIFLIIIRITT